MAAMGPRMMPVSTVSEHLASQSDQKYSPQVMAIHALGRNLAAQSEDDLGSFRERARNAFVRAKQQGSQILNGVTTKLKTWFGDEGVQVAGAAGATGSLAGFATGGAFGIFIGGAVGGALGMLPAIFTFGTTIPLGIFIGSGCGATIGSSVGGATGFFGAGTVGYGAYMKRGEIRSVFDRVSHAVKNVTEATCSRVHSLFASCKSSSSDIVGSLKKQFRHKADVAVDVYTRRLTDAKDMVADRNVQVVAASAASGAVVFGTGGAATGLATGSAIGAAVGVVPSFFTFGLALPVCSVIGGGFGMVAGSAVGAASGLVGGGLTGYVSYARRDEISSSMSSTLNKVDDCKKKVMDVADSMRHRLVGGTGGTMD